MREEEKKIVALKISHTSLWPAGWETPINSDGQVTKLGCHMARAFNHLPDKELLGDLGQAIEPC